MRYDEFKKFFEERPFKPIRIFITGGQSLDVRHPEQVIVIRSLFTFAVGPRNGKTERIGWYSLIHVVKVVPLNALRPRRKRGKRTA